MFALWIVFNNVAEEFNDETFPISTVVLLLGILFVFVQSTVIPLLSALFTNAKLSSDEHKEFMHSLHASRCSPSEKLLKILTHHIGKRYFRQYLISFYAVERN